MLIQFKLENFFSFNSSQTFSMLASDSASGDSSTGNVIPVNMFGIDSLLKSAGIFGANASGKSNFIRGMHFFKKIITESLTTVDSDNMHLIIPFLVGKKNWNVPTEFEVSFIHNKNLYRYGISVLHGKIAEEWLYWTKTSRETMLFHRVKQNIEINRRSFSEALDFVQKKDGTYLVEKTRENVPFLSVLAQFNGDKSRSVLEWFNKVRIVSGINEDSFRSLTINLFEKNEKFKKWALDILSSMQIQDIHIIEVDSKVPHLPDAEDDDDLNAAISGIKLYFSKAKLKEKKIEIVKHYSGDKEKSSTLPIAFESEGTKKLIYLLGPLYQAIDRGDILLIDEFDSKFHSLLTKYIVKLYQKSPKSNSQMIMTCHDTNLLTSDVFKRDQIWFIDKNENHESELYSLLEYKEHYTRKDGSYSKDYLSGKYGAIPLFESVEELVKVLNG